VKGSRDRVDRTVLLTGASSGIGRAAALELARRGARLRLTGRDPRKLDEVVAQARALGSEAIGQPCDMSSLADVRALASWLLERDEPLHVVVHNAGVWHASFRRSRDGYEDTFAVNHLAPFLLTHLLLPRLRESDGDRRIVHVSSRLHLQAGQTATLLGRAIHLLNVLGVPAGGTSARLEFDAIDREVDFRGLEAYARSKLGQLVFALELARREPGIASNAVHPGSVATDVTRDSRMLTWVAPAARLVLKTPEEGAETLLHAACDPSTSGVTGKYFARCREARYAAIADDRAVASELWTLSARLVGLDSDERRAPRR
jgi:retinol dehydrogenase-14